MTPDPKEAASPDDPPGPRGSHPVSRTSVLTAESGNTYEVHYGPVLGRGGQGVVYGGTDADGYPVAVKVVTLRTQAGTEPWYRDAAHALREAAVAQHALSQKVEGVVPLLDKLLDHEALVLVYPRASQCLAALAAARARPAASSVTTMDSSVVLTTDDEVRRIGAQLAGALHELHVHGVMHRDIKPGNALLWQGRWCWTDLGIARVLDDLTATHTFTMQGTVAYSAPEVLSRTDQTVLSDVYSLGCTLFEVATGRPPFPEDPVNGHLTRTPDLDALADPLIRHALTYALAKTPGSRPTAEQLAEMLGNDPEDGPTAARFREFASRGRRREDRRVAEEEAMARREIACRDAVAQLRRIWTDLTGYAKELAPDSIGGHEDESRSLLRVYDDAMIAIYGPPKDGACPATGVGTISMQRVNEAGSRAVANIYAKLIAGVGDEAGGPVSRWRLVQVQPSALRTGSPQRAEASPAVSLDDLEDWLVGPANAPDIPALVVVRDEPLTVETLMALFLEHAEESKDAD